MAHNLKEIVMNLKEARATANLSLDSVEPKYRGGVEGRIRDAERSIKELEQEYQDEVVENLVIVGLRGPSSPQFAELAKLSMLCVDQNMVVNIISKNINERLPNYSGFSGQELSALLGELNEIRANYGIFSIPPIENNGLAREVASLPLAQAVDKVLRANYGMQIHSAVIRRHVADTALADLYDAKGKLIVGVYNFDGLDPLILPPPHVIVDLNGEVTQATVEETLDKIRQSLRGGNATKKRGTAANKEPSNEQR